MSLGTNILSILNKISCCVTSKKNDDLHIIKIIVYKRHVRKYFSHITLLPDFRFLQPSSTKLLASIKIIVRTCCLVCQSTDFVGIIIGERILPVSFIFSFI